MDVALFTFSIKGFPVIICFKSLSLRILDNYRRD